MMTVDIKNRFGMFKESSFFMVYHRCLSNLDPHKILLARFKQVAGTLTQIFQLFSTFVAGRNSYSK